MVSFEQGKESGGGRVWEAWAPRILGLRKELKGTT